MKLIQTLLVMISLSGCGDPVGCKDELNGTWKNDQDTLTLNAIGACSGKSTYCESEFDFSAGEQMALELTVSSTNKNQYCPSVGSHSCKYDVYTTKLGRVFPDNIARTVDVTFLTVTCNNVQVKYEKVN